MYKYIVHLIFKIYLHFRLYLDLMDVSIVCTYVWTEVLCNNHHLNDEYLV